MDENCGSCGTYVDVGFYPVVNLWLCPNCALMDGQDELGSVWDDASFLEAVENFETDEDTEDEW